VTPAQGKREHENESWVCEEALSKLARSENAEIIADTAAGAGCTQSRRAGAGDAPDPLLQQCFIPAVEEKFAK